MRKKDRTDDGHDFSGLPAGKTISPADIQAKEFGVSRFGGYKMRDVDEFLDELTASMTKLTEENERLRGGAVMPAAPIGAGNLDESARQADQIIEQARAEAARIVKGAEDEAATTSGAVPSSGPDRAAVAAFLAREREFLQSLASLVQGHAEAIKGMAKAARPTKPAEPVATAARTDGPQAAAQAPSTEEPGRTEIHAGEARADGAPADEAPAAVTEESAGGGDAEAPNASAPQEPPAIRERDEPIRVEEPAPASVGRSEGDDEKETSDAERDRSLRELFWGED
jgi:DivIVA domain-containing protein